MSKPFPCEFRSRNNSIVVENENHFRRAVSRELNLTPGFVHDSSTEELVDALQQRGFEYIPLEDSLAA